MIILYFEKTVQYLSPRARKYLCFIKQDGYMKLGSRYTNIIIPSAHHLTMDRMQNVRDQTYRLLDSTVTRITELFSFLLSQSSQHRERHTREIPVPW